MLKIPWTSQNVPRRIFMFVLCRLYVAYFNTACNQGRFHISLQNANRTSWALSPEEDFASGVGLASSRHWSDYGQSSIRSDESSAAPSPSSSSSSVNATTTTAQEPIRAIGGISLPLSRKGLDFMALDKAVFLIFDRETVSGICA